MGSSLFLGMPVWVLVLICSCSVLIGQTEGQATPALVPGLSFTFYNTSCPNLETVIRDRLRTVFNSDTSLAAGILRLQFHDCMVQGCDGSVLLDGSTSGPSEKSAIPNLTLKPEVFTIINSLRDLAQNACGSPIVSCSDITAIATRDAVFLSGGPDYKVPLGRRDGTTFATLDDTLNNLFPPFANVTFLLDGMSAKNFDADDLVTLSGAHTIGRAHCPSFIDRLTPNQDPTMDPTLATNLKITCPTSNSTNTAPNDVRTPNIFDNQYYVDLVNRQGLFTSDQDLFIDNRTRSIVTTYAENQTLFFEKFASAMIKLTQLGVLTGTQGEIRVNCSARNPAPTNTSTTFLSSVVVDQEQTEARAAAF